MHICFWLPMMKQGSGASRRGMMSTQLQERAAGPPSVGLEINGGRIAPDTTAPQARPPAIGRELFAAMDRWRGFGGPRERGYEGGLQGAVRGAGRKAQVFPPVDVPPPP